MTAAEAPSGDKASKGLLRKPLVIVGLVLAVMAIEFVGLYFVLPHPTEAAESSTAHGDSHDDHGHGNAATTTHSDVEVFIDNFNTTNTKASPGSSVHLTFKLTAVVETAHSNEFGHAVNESQKARVRDGILRVTRSATLDDLNDPNLATFKRQLREEMNKTLRKSYVIECVISDFRAMEL